VHAPQVAELAHGSVAQPAEVHCQSAQLSPVGPVDEPVRHWPLETQKPQLASAVQVEQVVFERHGSSEPQLDENHDQLEHDPVDGPPSVPLWQVELSPQKPQPLRAVQVSQVAELAHGSGGMQLARVQFQSAHAPAAGPVEVPVMQVPVLSQKPQLERDVQVSQVVDEAHASALSHAKMNQSQSSQEPVDGPKKEPAVQVSVVSQKPQPLVVVQSPQVVSDAQRSRSVVQVPSSHARPAQQSESVVHVCDPVRHWQRPLAHNIEPQQSALVVQVLDASEQQMRAVGLSRQLKPVQHSVSAAHVERAAPQAGIARQVPLVHVSPPPHDGPVVQHGSSVPPHAVSQVPRVQPAPQVVPQLPQFRVSLSVSTQVPVQHARSPVHAAPLAQHSSPSPPHASGRVSHTPAVQRRPSLHALPAQQGCRAPPHASAVSHVPSVHARPDVHESISQHGWRSPPQASAVVHISRSHTSPARHEPPEQQP
jgi:hypothetical protein